MLVGPGIHVVPVDTIVLDGDDRPNILAVLGTNPSKFGDQYILNRGEPSRASQQSNLNSATESLLIVLIFAEVKEFDRE